MRILFLSRWFPYPPSNGSKLRVYNLLRGLAECHEVDLITFSDQPAVNCEAPQLRAICREVLVVPSNTFNPFSLKARLGLLSPTPRSIKDTYSTEMARQIQGTLGAKAYDLVIASQLGTAIYASQLSCVPALFEEVEVGVQYERYALASSTWNRLRYGLTWIKHRRFLANLLPKYCGCTVASEEERVLVSKFLLGASSDGWPIDVIPNGIDLASYRQVAEAPQPSSLIFTGSFRYAANYEGMVWFLKEVFPLVLAVSPEARLTITGDHASLPLPANENVNLTGLVEDVRPYIVRSWVSLAPIFWGGGTRLKILEAMALRTPVVATTKGAEGLDVRHGEHLLIADTPGAFAEAVLNIIQDTDLRRRLTDNAYALVASKYDWATIMPRFLALVERSALGTTIKAPGRQEEGRPV